MADLPKYLILDIYRTGRMALQELHHLRSIITRDSSHLYSQVSQISQKGDKTKRDFAAIVDLVFSFSQMISDIVVDRFSKVPKDILDVILDHCELVDCGALAVVCRRFRNHLENEGLWRKRSLILWKKIVPVKYLSSHLVWAKEKFGKMSWKDIVKHLSDNHVKKEGCTHKWNPIRKHLKLYYYAEGEIVAEKSMVIQLRGNMEGVLIGNVLKDGRGEGEKHFVGGDVQQGEWKNWKLDGPGEYLFPNGSHLVEVLQECIEYAFLVLLRVFR